MGGPQPGTIGGAPIKPQPELKPVPSGKKTLGIDVSHYEPILDYVKAKAGGVEWMYTKATEGTGHIDITLRKHVAAAKPAGLLTGAYHFMHASMDGELQAKIFLSTISGLVLDLPPCLDWESSSGDGLPALKQKVVALQWLDAVEKATGRIPMIYGGEAHLREMNLGDNFARYPLWLAHYGVKEDRLKIPAPWARYTAWQYTDAETVPGLAPGHHVDANWFNGSVEELRIFAKG